MKYSILFLLSISAFTYSCTSTTADDNKALQDSVISVHDEIMPMMGGFVRNSIKIDSILINLPRINIQDPGIDTAATLRDLRQLKISLDSSTEKMNDWMYEFEVDHEGKSKEEVTKYLKNELNKIQQLKNQFEDVSQESEIKLKEF